MEPRPLTFGHFKDKQGELWAEFNKSMQQLSSVGLICHDESLPYTEQQCQRYGDRYAIKIRQKGTSEISATWLDSFGQDAANDDEMSALVSVYKRGNRVEAQWVAKCLSIYQGGTKLTIMCELRSYDRLNDAVASSAMDDGMGKVSTRTAARLARKAALAAAANANINANTEGAMSALSHGHPSRPPLPSSSVVSHPSALFASTSDSKSSKPGPAVGAKRPADRPLATAASLAGAAADAATTAAAAPPAKRIRANPIPPPPRPPSPSAVASTIMTDADIESTVPQDQHDHSTNNAGVDGGDVDQPQQLSPQLGQDPREAQHIQHPVTSTRATRLARRPVTLVSSQDPDDATATEIQE